MDTSRQAVFDIIKRCHKMLLEYELKLNLMEKESSRSNSKSELLWMFDSLDDEVRSLSKILKIREFIIENL